MQVFTFHRSHSLIKMCCLHRHLKDMEEMFISSLFLLILTEVEGKDKENSSPVLSQVGKVSPVYATLSHIPFHRKNKDAVSTSSFCLLGRLQLLSSPEVDFNMPRNNSSFMPISDPSVTSAVCGTCTERATIKTTTPLPHPPALLLNTAHRSLFNLLVRHRMEPLGAVTEQQGVECHVPAAYVNPLSSSKYSPMSTRESNPPTQILTRRDGEPHVSAARGCKHIYTEKQQTHKHTKKYTNTHMHLACLTAGVAPIIPPPTHTHTE